MQLKAFTKGGDSTLLTLQLPVFTTGGIQLVCEQIVTLYQVHWILLLSCALLFAGWLHLQPKFRPSLSWFKNNESRLNHHLSGLFGVSSLAWTGHTIHVAIPASTRCTCSVGITS